MKILVDMNLSPSWCKVFQKEGWDCAHWSSIGDTRASDESIMKYAREHGYVVFTHDLDFSAILASTQMTGPSVIQVRTQDVLSTKFRALVVSALRQFESELLQGALIVVDESRLRARVLPLS